MSLKISGPVPGQINAGVKSGLKAALAAAMGLPTRYFSDPVITTTRRRQLRQRRSLAAAPFYAAMDVEVPNSVATTYLLPTMDVLAGACTSFLQTALPQQADIAVSVTFDLGAGFPTLSPAAAPALQAASAAASSVGIIAGAAVGAILLAGLAATYFFLNKAAQKARSRSNRSSALLPEKISLEDIAANSIPWASIKPLLRTDEDKRLQGSYGSVFRARYDNETVAVKIFRVFADQAG